MQQTIIIIIINQANFYLLIDRLIARWVIISLSIQQSKSIATKHNMCRRLASTNNGTIKRQNYQSNFLTDWITRQSLEIHMQSWPQRPTYSTSENVGRQKRSEGGHSARGDATSSVYTYALSNAQISFSHLPVTSSFCFEHLVHCFEYENLLQSCSQAARVSTFSHRLNNKAVLKQKWSVYSQ